MTIEVATDALGHQEGGDHYKGLKIQPIEYMHANGIPFAEGNVIKYVTRWRDKGGIADLKKARHFIDLLIELELKSANPNGVRVDVSPTAPGASDLRGTKFRLLCKNGKPYPIGVKPGRLVEVHLDNDVKVMGNAFQFDWRPEAIPAIVAYQLIGSAEAQS